MYEMQLLIHTIFELSRWVKGYCFIRSYVRSCIRWTYVFSSKIANNIGTPGANLTYLAPPGQFFMGAKIFIGTTEMQRIFVLNDKLNYTMKNCMVSMAAVNVILKHGGVHTKLIISSLLLILDY